MSAEGIEPSTNGLKGRCSAIELRARETSEWHSNTGESERQRKILFYREARKDLKVFLAPLAGFAVKKKEKSHAIRYS